MSVVKLKMVKKFNVYIQTVVMYMDLSDKHWQVRGGRNGWFHPQLKLLLRKLVYIKTLPFLKDVS